MNKKEAQLYSDIYCNTDGKRFDFLKIILAILVVAIHTTPTNFILIPVLRLAVPIFFIMTSYFFFSKQKRLNSLKEKKHALLVLIRRFLYLYLFWFIVLLPVTIVVRKWYISPGINTIFEILRNFLFGSTFRASWFLMASLLNIIFVWFVSNKIGNYILLFLGFALYYICCLFSNYYNIIGNSHILYIYHIYAQYIAAPYNSFPVALVFVMFGKILSEKSFFVQQRYLFMLILISLSLLFTEYYVIQHFNLSYEDDSFLFLIPASLYIFMFIGQCQWSCKRDTHNIRKASTVIYCCHCSYATIIYHLLFLFNIQSVFTFHLIWFLLTLSTSFITYIIIRKAEDIPLFHFLRYAH